MKFAHKLTLALLVVLAVVLSLCNTVLIGQQFRQELHTAQETLSADWQRESRAMQRTLVTPGSGSLAARVGSYLQAITEQNSLACAAYSVDGTSLYYALPTAVPLSEVEALLAAYLEIRPMEVMLYSIDRATPEENLQKVPKEELETIAERFRAKGIKVQVN